MINAVIFDMDGLMIDSEHLQSQAFIEIIRQYGKEPIINTNGLVQIQGLRGDDNWRIIQQKHGIIEDIHILRKKRRAIYIQLLEKYVKPMKGLKKLIAHLQSKHVKMAVASSSPKNQIQFVLKKFSLFSHFSAIASGEDVRHSKPHPEIFLLTSNLLRIAPKHCLVLEDAESGIVAAKSAKMKAIAIPNTYTIHHDFSKADRILESLEMVSALFP